MKITGLKELEKRLKGIARDVEREVRIVNRTSIEMPVKTDVKGFYDRECPFCRFRFKMFRDEGACVGHGITCPYCGHMAPSDRWFTTEHVQRARRIGLRHTELRFRRAIRGPSRSTVPSRLSYEEVENVVYEHDGRRRVITVPADAAQPMKQEKRCSQCGCGYGFIGIASFCPSCGHNSIHESFSENLTVIRNLGLVLTEIKNSLDEDVAATASRALLEKSIQDIVMLFQRIAESLYTRITEKKPKLNSFQRLGGRDDANSLWKSATGKELSDYLSQDEWDRVRVYFQRRHLLSHNEGMVDQIYIDRSGDKAYHVGQRLIIQLEEIDDFSTIIEKLVSSMSMEIQWVLSGS